MIQKDELSGSYVASWHLPVHLLGLCLSALFQIGLGVCLRACTLRRAVNGQAYADNLFLPWLDGLFAYDGNCP